MADAEHISELVAIGLDDESLQVAQQRAAAAIKAFDGEIFPSDSCAITQSKLLQAAGIKIPDTFLALGLIDLLESRKWTVYRAADVRSGKVRLKAGDIGTTCYGGVRHPGTDHVYLVLRPLNENENLIADNQARAAHVRFIDGTGGKSPTICFLRAT